ncbi:MAG: DUF4190 domain-containing protein [Mycobacteriaceae bacterium]|nr:DUF4190 domain-containing protein [Mycobacteriaceae bacterium]
MMPPSYPSPPGGYPPPPPGGYLPPGGYPPPPPGGYQPPQSASGTNGLATASLICSILGCCGILGFAAIVLGVVSLNQIKTSGQGGRGMAIAGIVIGIVWLALHIVVASIRLGLHHY